MAENKTHFNDASVAGFLQAVAHPVRRADALALDAMFRRVSGFEPRMFGPTIVGYGRYAYTYGSGYSGTCQATGFSPRKAHQVIYIMPGYQDFSHILKRLGKHKLGKSCLYINKLADVEMAVLEELVAAGLADLGKRWLVEPT
ncbi:DUF1801 domain-containing protein [Yoonia sediminilitoris]|uniref:Uncharacterized protein DUF1801 n=1 Tax=Yoonia sediminilitoris TaxID=1286148 RepID=A0A2T6KG02_9RHOB|nr:DUF1801 domain-containing protein [Yoonia sediminilitoris]PUB14200.1 uncharacterized protein DUF1801 [Yoonia sediminilitoris]RCW95131.1 uncharacterized protein DUF1801 [Yoonia sediminilitoris]